MSMLRIDCLTCKEVKRLTVLYIAFLTKLSLVEKRDAASLLVSALR